MKEPRQQDVATGDDQQEVCPSCDEEASWEVSSRHRFSPFGSVLLGVVAFWTAALGWALDFGYGPGMVLLVIAALTGVATRKAEVCGACGYVRPKGT